MKVSISRWREFFGGLIAFMFCALAAYYFYRVTIGELPWGVSVAAIVHLVIGLVFFFMLNDLQLEANQDADSPVEKTDS